MTIKIVNTSDNPLPKYQTEGSVGMDLMASKEVVIRPGHWELVPTGLFMEIPKGFEGQVRPRSGLANKFGVTVLNTPGTIDSDYRGEVGVILINHNDAPHFVHAGARIAQIVFAPVSIVDLQQVEKLTELEQTERGCGGFGHTGMVNRPEPHMEVLAPQEDIQESVRG